MINLFGEEAGVPYSDFFSDEKEKNVVSPLRKTVPDYVNPFNYERVTPKEQQSITELDTDPVLLEKFNRVMEYLGDNSAFTNSVFDPTSTISETMRDDNISIAKLIDKTVAFKDAPDSIKQDYADIKNSWDDAGKKGFTEWMDMFQDYTVDIATDPAVLAGIAGTFFTGTASAVAAGGTQLTARAALANTLRRAAAGAVKTTGGSGYKGTAVRSAAASGIYDIAGQHLDLAIKRQKEYSPTQTAITAAIGGVAGPALEAGVRASAPHFKRFLFGKSKVNQQASEGVFEETIDFKTREDRAREAFEAAAEQAEKGEMGYYTPTGQTKDSFPALIGLPGRAAKVAKDLETRVLEGRIIDLEEENYSILDDLVDDLGGGQATKEFVVDAVNVAQNQPDPEKVAVTFFNKLHRFSAGASSTMFFGKASGILSPYRKYSETAKQLQGKFSREFNKVWRGNQFKIEGDFAEVQQRYNGEFYTTYIDIVEPLSYDKVKGKLKDNVNASLSMAMRGVDSDVAGLEPVYEAARKMQELYSDIGDRLVAAGVIDKKVDNYIPRMWNRTAIEKNPDRFAQLLVDQGEANNIADGRRIMEDLLEKRNQLDSGTDGHFFSAKRKFNNIQDDFVFEEFLNTDVLGTLHNYTHHAAKSLAKKEVFGVNNIKEFEAKWINPIAEDHYNSTGKSLSKIEKSLIMNLYRSATGEGQQNFEYIQTGMDTYGLMNRLAYLGGATISSLTEVFVNIADAGFVKSVKGFNDALETSFKLVTKDTETKLKNQMGLTAAEIKKEMFEFSIAVDQGVSQMGNRLAGNDLQSDRLQGVSNGYFKFIGLDLWTKFAQTVTFATGKRLIMGNLEEVSEYLSSGAKISSRIQNKIDELNELGIDIEEGTSWLGSGANLQDSYYKEIKQAAARYTNDVVLMPDSMASTRPMMYSHPKTQLAFQLLSYPAAFTNVILKGAAKKLTRNPKQNTANVLLSGLFMMEGQRIVQYLKTGGKSEEDKTPSEARIEAMKRVGAPGLLFQQIDRATETAGYTGTVTPFLIAPFGPAGSDIAGVAQGRPVQTLGTKAPFYSLYGNVAKITGNEDEYEDYKQYFKDLDRTGSEILRTDKPIMTRDLFSKGGVVEVPNAPEEPDERIDKMTGQPYNEQAGLAFIDEEDPKPVSLLSKV